MTTARSDIRRAATAAILIMVTLCSTGCWFDHSGPPAWETWGCSGTIWRYAHSTPSPLPTSDVRLGPGFGSTGVIWVPLSGGGASGSPTLYLDRSWTFSAGHPLPNDVKGSYLLAGNHGSRTDTSAGTYHDYLVQLDLGSHDVSRFWIAFDERAATPPTWLTDHYRKVEPELFLVSTEVYFEGGTPHRVRYRLWTPKTGPGQLLRADLGGANAQGVQWRHGRIGSQYLVLLRMRPAPVPSTKIRSLGPIGIEAVNRSPGDPIDPSVLPGAAHEALAKWATKPANAGYRTAYDAGLIGVEVSATSCVKKETTVNGTKRELRVPFGCDGSVLLGSWPRASSGTVDPSRSAATVTVSGYGPVTTAVQGRIDFDVREDTSASVDNIDLWGHPVTLGDGTRISGITLSQLLPMTASCADGLSRAPQRLCTRYEVPVGDDGFFGGIALEVEGRELTVLLRNDAALALDVDLNAMRYAFSGGPLIGRLEVNERVLEASVSLTIAGDFVDLAPAADIAETPLEWECGDNGVVLVHLSGTASTDELDPSDIAGYEWYEDVGALTTTHLGSGATLSLPMGYGRHDLALEVRDHSGSVSTRHFGLDVVDSGIDAIQRPPDRWVEVQDPPATRVDVGTASASDICSGRVDITHDAPAGGLFPAGLSKVRWLFDDGRGNVVRHTQRIFVLEPAFLPPPISDLYLAPAAVAPGQAVAVTHDTWPQGRGMLLDEYVLIRAEDGSTWYLDGSGALAPDPIPRATLRNLGAAATSTVVFSGAIDPLLAGPGVYAVEAVLVPPGGDPREPAEIVAWSAAELELLGP